MNKYTVKFQVEGNYASARELEIEIADLLRTTVFPALGVSEIPLSIETKRARG
jgi:hypothetical protein